MIIYDLECGAKHRFEGWFKNANEYTEQQHSGLLICPVCGSERIRKIPSASYINKSGSSSDKSEGTNLEKEVVQHQVVKMFHEYINKNFDDVGSKFAEEAKKMHYGETEERNIRGTATSDEIRELKDEGVSAVQLPPAPYDKDKLN
ncbi:MAG: DUF1178 family protein [Gammaproteobacteria bacterium]|nr:DUF1178 family protein [Gammaproteobacteria bacterium]